MKNRTIRTLLVQTNVTIFPTVDIFANRISTRRQLMVFCALFIPFFVLGMLLPADEFFGFDWIHFFGRGVVPAFYPPWTNIIVRALSWPLLIGFTFAAICLAIIKRAKNYQSAICAVFALPVFWTLFLGQLDGLVILGLLGLPWFAPLALIKPQVSLFAFGARRSYFLALVLTLLGSIVIWGFWPVEMFAVWDIHAEGRYMNDISIGLLGLPLALPMLWLSRGDVDMMMLSGSIISPYLLPYNFLPIVPAIARLPWPIAVIAMLLSWLPLSANWIGTLGWWTGWLLVIWLWLNLAILRYPGNKFSTYVGLILSRTQLLESQ